MPTSTAGNNTTNAASTAFTTGAINTIKAGATWTGTQTFTGATIRVSTATAGNSTTTAASTAFTTGAINTIKAGATWTGTQDFTGSTITVPTKAVGTNTTDAASCAFVLANSSGSSSGLLASTNTWTGASNTFNNVVNVNSISAPSGTLTITGDINGTDILSTSGDFQNPTATASCRFARTTTSGTVNIATNQTTGTLNIGTFSTRTGDINIGATTSTTIINGQLNCDDGTSIYTVWGKLCVAFTGGFDYNIVSANINNIFMLVINGGNPRVIQMPERKIGQYIIIRSISGVSHTISVSLNGGNFYNPNATTTSLSYSMPSGTVVRYLDNGTNWIAF